ncbi:AAA family ATPase [Aliisedimentitalea scapharcae]|uniref:AAA family ATPase n=1 Tax=Aliisedimentitalea scapharcae TaxID=1524259 RepID=A0ABZ2XU30_9RHOB
MDETPAIPEIQSTRLGERRLVSVLFTDMVGYTAIVERLGAEKTLQFTRMVYKELTGAVQDHGGSVRGFAGDSVMAVFGIPDAQEDAALRACQAALSIQKTFGDATEDIEARFGERPSMRVGVSSGTVVMAHVEGEGSPLTAVGNTVNLASRIEALAPRGGCLICDATRSLVEWLVDLSFDDEYQIKGVAKPQKLWRLLSIREGATRFDASLARGLSQYIGRDAELATLAGALERARDRVQVVDLVAEPGLGKTRLIFEFLNPITKEDAFVLTGHCSANGQQTPFLPFLEVMRGSFQIRDEDEPFEIARKLETGLRRAGLDTPENLGLLLNLLGLPPPDGSLDGLDGVLIGLRTRDLLPALLQAQCQATRVVLLIEDIHWIDGASEEMLRKLIESGTQSNLLILLTRRPEYDPGWCTLPWVKALALQPLEDGDIWQLARTRLGVETLPDALIQQVTERAGGNPLFGEEILSYLIDQGALRITSGTAEFDAEKATSGLPASMQSLLTARIDRLQPQDQALLQAAATIGRRFDPGLLSLVIGRAGETGAALHRLQAQDIVYRETNSSDYMFKHVLLRDTVYQGLVSDRRADLHLAIAEALVQRNQDRLAEVADTLAYHYAQTDRKDLAFRYSALAGAKSLGVFSHDQANRYFASALALYLDDPTCASDAEFAEFLANYALCSNISLMVKPMIELAPKVRPILNGIGDSGDHVLFLHHYVSCLVCSGRYRDALGVQQELTAMANRLGDPKSIAYALVNELSVSIYCAPIPDDVFETKRQEAETALTCFDDAYLKNFFVATVGWNELTRGRVTKAHEAADRMRAEGISKNDPRSLGYGTAMKALIAMVTDDHQTALEISEQAHSVSRAEFEMAIADSSRFSALVPLGKPGALEDVRGYVDMCKQNGWALFAEGPETMLGVALAMDGQIGAGLRQIEDAIARREAEGTRIAADWNRLFLCEVYLEILSGEGGASLGVLMRNISALTGVFLFGGKRIIELIEHVRANPQFDPAGHYIARSELILGLLYKIKKKKAQALQHLNEAKRIVEPAGKSPMLTRINVALAELNA